MDVATDTTRTSTSVLTAIREQAVGQIAAEARSVDRDRQFAAVGLQVPAAAGGYGSVAPESVGGGGSLTSLVDAREAVGAACASTGMVLVQVTERALEVCGGQGYTPALPVERHLRDARAGTVTAPTNAGLKTCVGKALAGLPVP